MYMLYTLFEHEFLVLNGFCSTLIDLRAHLLQTHHLDRSQVVVCHGCSARPAASAVDTSGAAPFILAAYRDILRWIA